ncbi:MAG: translocation/assembly module TamB domain-containing protein [Bacteroidota bacterium]
MLVVVVFSIPAVQSFVAQRFTNNINETYGTDISIDRVQIGLDGKIALHNALVTDQKKDTIIHFSSFSTSLINLKSAFNNDVKLTDGKFENLTLKIIRYNEKDPDSFNQFLQDLNLRNSKQKKKDFLLELDYLMAIESRFIYLDYTRESPEIFKIDQLNFDTRNFVVDNGLVTTSIIAFNGKTGRGFNIENITTDFSYSKNEMIFRQLNLSTDESEIEAELKMNYEPEDFKDFNNLVAIDANFSNGTISTSDLGNLYNEFGYGESLSFDGRLIGNMNDFSIEDLNLSGLKNSKIVSKSLHFKNLLDRDKNFVLEGNYDQLHTNFSDLANLFPRLIGENLPNELNRFGQLNLKGFARIDGSDLSTDLSAATGLGRAVVKLDFKNMNQPESVTYKGDLTFNNIKLNKAIANDRFGQTSFNLKVDGKSFKRSNLDTRIKGIISSFEFNDYVYEDLEVNGQLTEPLFNGKLISNDENFQMEFNGLADLSEEASRFDFKAQITHADLKKINVFTRDSIALVTGDVSMDIRGQSIDDIEGNIQLKDFTYQNEKEKFNFDDLKVLSVFEGEKRTININSPDVVSGNMEGIFRLTQLPEIALNAFENLYYREEPEINKDFAYVDFKFDIYNKIIEAFFPEIQFKSPTSLDGSIVSNENYFRLNFTTPEISVYNNAFENVNLQIDNKDPLINTSITIDSISSSIYNASKLRIINQTKNDTLFMKANLTGGKQNQDDFDVNLYQTTNDKNDLVVGFLDSDLQIKSHNWKINQTKTPQNRIIIEKGFRNFTFDSIQLTNNEEYIKLNGKIRDTAYKDLNLELHQVELTKVTPYLNNLDLKGKVNGKLHIFQEKGLYAPNLDVRIDDFGINKTTYGNLYLEANGDEDLDTFRVSSTLKNQEKGITHLALGGEIYIKNNQQYLDLEAETTALDLSPFSSLGKDVVSDIRGFADGGVKITGQANQPKFRGKISLTEAGLKVPYLNIDYDFIDTAEVNILPSGFVFTDIDIRDTEYETQARLDGAIFHTNFKDWELDLNVSGENMLALNTPYKEGALYHGTAFIAGNAEIVGPTDNLIFNVNARTQKNTVFKIPLEDSDSFGDISYIYFLTEEDKKAQNEGKSIQLREVKGLSLNFDLDITEDAEVEIVVDKTSGSTLKGSGTGNLLIEINTNGKFNMYGDFEVAEGVYDFRYAGLVQKKFDVEPGGTLTWNGDPLQANMNLNAKYKTQANPAMILENPSINREIPVEVIISLNGELIQPDINFDINYPNLSSVVKSELDYRIQGRENTEIQALSLVTQGTFYSMDGLGQGALTGNLIEGASSIMDGLLANEDDNFKIGLDYTQAQRIPDQNQTGDRVGMSFQTQISDRILINGRFGVPVGGTTESFIFGDVEMNLLLNDSGSLRANVFNRESDIQFIGEELGYTQGIGISYSVDFNNFKHLLRIIMNKKEKEQEKKDVSETNNKSVLPDYIRLPHEVDSRESE